MCEERVAKWVYLERFWAEEELWYHEALHAKLHTDTIR
jgi:hypothetical protein